MSSTAQNIHAMFKAPTVLYSPIQRKISLNWKHTVTFFSTLQEARTLRKAFKQQGFTKIVCLEQRMQCCTSASGSGPDKDYMHEEFNDCISEEFEGICDYQSSFEEPISVIALKNIHLLSSIPLFGCSEKAYKKILESEIIPALNSKNITTKVYVLNGTPVAFINYTISNPKRWFESWYNKIVPEQIGPNASMHHLAVDDMHQGKGIGKILVSDALQDCQNKSVNCITLFTTPGCSSKTESFYKHFGFEITKESATKLGATKWCKRFKPHPLTLFTASFLAHMKKLFKSKE